MEPFSVNMWHNPRSQLLTGGEAAFVVDHSDPSGAVLSGFNHAFNHLGVDMCLERVPLASSATRSEHFNELVERRKNMRRIIRFLFAFAIATAGMVGFSTIAAQAASPHFLTHSFSIDRSTGNLLCSFKEAGLGNTATVADITCTAGTSEAVYQCFNNGGNHPKAGNKETVGGLVTGTQSFPVRNGQTTGTVTVGPVSQGSFACPPGQSLFLISVCYDDITLSGEGATIGPFYTGTNELCATGLMLKV